jgi:ribosome biogenesis GTPase / thiamine phosphate phosphatase
MTTEDFGFNEQIKNTVNELELSDFVIGRVVLEHKERYIVKTEQGEFDAEITGNLRFSASTREDFPAVGDWVALILYDSEFAIIHKILPRLSVISRQAVGKVGEEQIIATNIDCALLVQSVDRDFNINRLQRYLSICYASKVEPVIVLTKTDLADANQIAEMVEKVKNRLDNVPVFPVSSENGNGFEALINFIEKGKTYCLLGSSGAGKSTLLNNLAGKTTMLTNTISESTHKGKHTTTHRELIVLESGGIIIDNPGMREVGVVDSSDGVNTVFNKIITLSAKCKYKDCSHTTENGCAVLDAVANGDIDKNTYDNYLKIEREKNHFELSSAEKRKKDKDFGKMVKNYKKNKSIR